MFPTRSYPTPSAMDALNMGTQILDEVGLREPMVLLVVLAIAGVLLSYLIFRGNNDD